MILGTPASNSMAVPKGRFNHDGQISVKNSAIPKLTGNAINNAITEVINVPTMAIRPPYLSLTGSHSMVVTKARPNSCMAGTARMNNEKMIPSSTINTNAAKLSVSLWKKKSCQRWRRMTFARFSSLNCVDCETSAFDAD